MLAPLALALLSISSLAAQETTPIQHPVRTYDLRLLSHAHIGDASYVPHGFHLFDAPPSDWGLREGSSPHPAPPLKFPIHWELVLDRFLEGAFGFSDLRVLSESPDRITLQANPGAHREIETLLTELEEQILRRVEVHAYRFSPEDVPPGTASILAPEAVLSLLKQAPPKDHEQALIRLNRRARMGSVDRASFVLDTEVIAQSVLIGPEPLVAVLTEGLEIAVEVRASFRGELELRVFGRRGSGRGADRVMRTAIVPGGEAVTQLAQIRSERFSGSAFLEDGGGLLVGSNHPESGYVLITAKKQGWSAAGERLLPTSVLVSAPLAVYGDPPNCSGEPEWSRRHRDSSWPLDFDQIRHAAWSVETLSEGLEAALEGMPPDSLGSHCEWFDGEIFLKGSRVCTARAIQFLRDQARVVERHVRVELRIGEIENDKLLSEEALDLNALASRMRHRAIGATRIGGTMTLSSIEETMHPFPPRLEERKNASFQHPRTTILHEGFAVTFYPKSIEANSVRCHVEWTEQAISRSRQPAPKVQRTELIGSFESSLGEWSLACRRRLSGTTRSKVLLVRVLQ